MSFSIVRCINETFCISLAACEVELYFSTMKTLMKSVLYIKIHKDMPQFFLWFIRFISSRQFLFKLQVNDKSYKAFLRSRVSGQNEGEG